MNTFFLFSSSCEALLATSGRLLTDEIGNARLTSVVVDRRCRELITTHDCLPCPLRRSASSGTLATTSGKKESKCFQATALPFSITARNVLLARACAHTAAAAAGAGARLAEYNLHSSTWRPCLREDAGKASFHGRAILTLEPQPPMFFN